MAYENYIELLMKLPNPKLSKRMLSFIDHAIKDLPFWDVCCDHGYVGIRALESKQFSEVHFVDKIPHIMERLDILIKQSWKIENQKYFLYLMPGESIETEVHGTLLIAGVGGLTIKTIIETLSHKNKLSAQRLLLSPHTDEKVLIAYIASEEFLKNYVITQKVMLPEGPRERPLYVADLRIPRKDD